MSRSATGQGPSLTTEETARLHLALKSAAELRDKLDKLERDALILGRRHGLSWDQIGAYIRVSGETLRTRARRACIADYDGLTPAPSRAGSGGTLRKLVTSTWVPA